MDDLHIEFVFSETVDNKIKQVLFLSLIVCLVGLHTLSK